MIADLSARGLLFERRSYEHYYPYCWRCDTPLIYYAKPRWYIATTAIRDRLLAANEPIAWHPPHIKEGRFGDWLRTTWTGRSPASATGARRYRCGAAAKATSRDRLVRRAGGTPGQTLSDHHRPYVDEHDVPLQRNRVRRADAPRDGGDRLWFDSGAMPFAQHHAPFEHQARFEARFPADFICEAIDQTRGWFYSLITISTLLKRPRSRIGTYVCLGLLVNTNGQKMSKSRGNVIAPWEILERYGADAFRWYFFTSKQPWDGYRFSEEAIGEGVRLFLSAVETYYFTSCTRTPARDAEGDDRAGASSDDLDRWALSRCAGPPSRWPSAWTPTTRPPRAGDRGVRGRALQLVRAPLAPRASGPATRPPSPRCAPAY